MTDIQRPRGSRRHLVAVRSKDWRLYRYQETEPWKLFDLEKDAREEEDIADQYPDVVEKLAYNHAEWKSTLAPLLTKPEEEYVNPGPVTPAGYSWVVTDGWAVPEKKQKR
ncbi:MAG: hypothetical protein F9B45_15750 [Phycisphaera sp. RhM]|nr:hypothetical protein [Phycisphaera sp. RhM]